MNLIFKRSIVFLIILSIIIACYPAKANAAVVTCQKPLDVVIVIDNSSSIGEYPDPPVPPGPGATQGQINTYNNYKAAYDDWIANNGKQKADQEWPNIMQFVLGFINGFEVSPEYVHISIVTFDGVSMFDRVVARAKMDAGKEKNKYGGNNGYQPVPLYNSPSPRHFEELGALRFSDTISNLTYSRFDLTNGNNTGKVDQLISKRVMRDVKNVCYKEPKYYYTNPKEKSPLSDNFLCGSTDIASGLNRAKTILDGSNRAGTGISRKVILITDGLPDDDIKDESAALKSFDNAGATNADLALYPYLNEKIEPNKDPVLIASNKLKNNGSNSAEIFAITVGKEDICPLGGNAAKCTGLKDRSSQYMTSIASDPKSSYKFDVNDFSNFKIILDSILKFACGVEGVNVNGFLLTNNQVKTDRILYVNNDFNYIGNNYIDAILRNLSIGRHFIGFD